MDTAAEVKHRAALRNGGLPLRRHNGKCHVCKKAASILARRTNEWCNEGYVFEDADGFKHLSASGGTIDRECCGRRFTLSPVQGRLAPAHKCDARCLNATGHNCECACGGKNHGAGHSA